MHTRILTVFNLLKQVGFAVLFGVQIIVQAQPPDTLWTRALLQDRITVLTSGWLSNSDQITLAGFAADTIRPGGAPYDFALGKINTSGELESYSRYQDIPSGRLSQFGSACQDHNGNVLIAGLGGLGTACLKVDGVGDTIWSRSYFTLATSVRKVICSDTSGFLFCGARFGIGENLLDGYIMKISPEGDSLWFRQFVGSFGTTEEIWDVVAEGNGFLLSLSGETNSPQNPDTIFTDIIRTDEVGNTVDRWQYRFTSYTIVRDLSVDSGGQIYAAGHVRDQQFQGDRRLLFSVDHVGSVLWIKIGEEEQFSSSYAQVESAYDNGGCIVLGNVEYALDDRVLLESYSSNGDTNWYATYSPSFLDTGDNVIFTNIVRLENGRYLLHGPYSKIIPESRYGTGLILTEEDPLNATDCALPLPQHFSLSVFPNPFNSTLSISLDVPLHQDVTLSLYDLLGREVDVVYRGRLSSSTISYVAPAALSSGVYFLRAASGERATLVKVVLLK